MNTKYKNLLFDADQTLIDFEKDMPLAFQYMYEQSGLAKQKPYSAEILRLYNDCNESWWRRFEQKLCTKAELYRNRFVDFFEVAGLSGMPTTISLSSTAALNDVELSLRIIYATSFAAEASFAVLCTTIYFMSFAQDSTGTFKSYFAEDNRFSRIGTIRSLLLLITCTRFIRHGATEPL